MTESELQRRICNHYGRQPEPNGKFLNDFSRARARPGQLTHRPASLAA
jgi:hypothetical protein